MNATLREVSYHVRAATLLDDVTLTIPPGSLTAVIGPNGAGKSTLLHLLAGDSAPTSGVVSYDGEPVSSIGVERRARLRALLPQRHVPDVTFTVEQVVSMGRFPYRYDLSNVPADDERAVDEAIDLLDLSDLRFRTVRSLSGGEQQRVAIARVLAQRASLVLLDEPTTALDIAHRATVMSLIEGLQPQGHTVVAVLHDLDLAAYFDHVVLLDRGTVAAAGLPKVVLTSDTLTTVYRHPIDVVDSPNGDSIIVLPRRIAPTRSDR